MTSVVLVTGVSTPLGARVATDLLRARGVSKVVGIDSVPASPDLARSMDGIRFVRVDIRNPLIATVIETEQVDTVVHLSVTPAPVASGSRSAMKEFNVIGTMQLLAAAQNSERMRRLVVKSSTAVYGSSSADPAVFTEDTDPPSTPSSGFGKDVVEVEGYLRGFARRRPDIVVSVLRFANVVGPTIDSSLTRYLLLPVVPTVFGYDPRLQMLHEDDAVAVVRRAATHNLHGTVNVAGSGIMPLSQAIRRAGRLSAPVPAPAIDVVARLMRGTRRVDFTPDQARALTFGRAVDTTRLRTAFGYRPAFTTIEAFDDFVRGRGLRPAVDPEWVDACLRRIMTTVQSREPTDA
ncbi:MAG: NAD-dependent epimerase/dehydratase family protein [Mycobacteriales bacterium]|nr:MAG: hypothetical protein DLM56_11265 [Pseudonocardiales bacterium]